MLLKVAQMTSQKVAHRLLRRMMDLVVVAKDYYYKISFLKGLSKISILACLYLTWISLTREKISKTFSILRMHASRLQKKVTVSLFRTCTVFSLRSSALAILTLLKTIKAARYTRRNSEINNWKKSWPACDV